MLRKQKDQNGMALTNSKGGKLYDFAYPLYGKYRIAV
jgi:hypothetical protein